MGTIDLDTPPPPPPPARRRVAVAAAIAVGAALTLASAAPTAATTTVLAVADPPGQAIAAATLADGRHITLQLGRSVDLPRPVQVQVFVPGADWGSCTISLDHRQVAQDRAAAAGVPASCVWSG